MATVTLALTDEELTDVLTTAGEGGSNYWCRSSARLTEAMTRDVTIWDAETRELLGVLNAEKLRAAGAAVATKVSGRLLSDMVTEGPAMDADAADAYVQIALFGELVYG